MSVGGLWTVLPVKAWAEAKRRLSPVLSGEERQELARCMLDDLLGAIGGASRVTPRARRHLGPGGPASTWPGPAASSLPNPRRGLNLALGTAAGELKRRGASTMLVLPIDLPLVKSADLDALCDHHLEGGQGAAARATVTRGAPTASARAPTPSPARRPAASRSASATVASTPIYAKPNAQAPRLPASNSTG